MKELEASVLRGAPDESDAKHRFERIAAAATDAALDLSDLDEDTSLLLSLCCQRAPYLAKLLAREPSRLLRVGESPYLHRAKRAEILSEELARLVENVDETEDFDRILRSFRADELVRLGAREMELGTPFEVGEELSNLADACLDRAIKFHAANLNSKYAAPTWEDPGGKSHAATLSVIAMGKLGGQELNFCSDVDLIYIYSSDDGSAGNISLQEYFTKLCRLVSGSIGDITDEDCVFRVDLRLRPEGSRGTIANSLRAAEAYYASFGRPWERQAWLKARACAGDLELGDEIMDMMRPFVYPRSVSPNIIEEVQELNKRIKSELGSGAVDTGFDLKNGLGGIREIEFFVQALQLIHGGHRPRLQTRSTIGALDELLFCGLVSEEERYGMAEAYRYLRHLEHMVQLDSGRQTQRLPTESEEVELLAKRTKHSGAAELYETLRKHTQFVQEAFETLGDEDQGPPTEIQTLLRGQCDRAQEEALLKTLGFRDPAQAWLDFDTARNKTLSPYGGAAAGQTLRVAPMLLTEIARSPDPDQALRYSGELIARRGTWSAIWGMMNDNPDLLRLITSVFGTSLYLSKAFINHPELFDGLLTAGLAKASYTQEELAEKLASHEINRLADREEQWSSLAEFKNNQVLRIGLADIAGALDPEEVCRQLSDVAELCVQCAYSLVADDLRERFGTPRTESGEEITMAVLAMGKLGGHELGYASDLDIVFVFSGAGESDGPRNLDAATYMSRIAQRMMSGLHSLHPGGRLYEIDTRLRPSGSRGLLVSTLAAWQHYHKASARLWERQSLTKLRKIAGSEALGEEARAIAEACIYLEHEHQPKETAEGIAQMRNQIWSQLVAPQKRIDFKAGHGGLIDIEFAAQYLQLVHGGDEEKLRTTSTTEALAVASELGLAAEESCELLIEGYRFLRRLEHRLRIVHDRSEHHLPDDPIELDKLARRIGYPDGPQLQEDYQRWSRDVHDAYVQVLGLSVVSRD